MARQIPAAERIIKARKLIEKARAIPRPDTGMFVDFSYTAQVKDTLRQALDLVKFIRYTPTASDEVKQQVEALYQEAADTEKELLKKV